MIWVTLSFPHLDSMGSDRQIVVSSHVVCGTFYSALVYRLQLCDLNRHSDLPTLTGMLGLTMVTKNLNVYKSKTQEFEINTVKVLLYRLKISLMSYG